VGQQQNARARKQPKVEREVKIENDEMKVKVDDEWGKPNLHRAFLIPVRNKI